MDVQVRKARARDIAQLTELLGELFPARAEPAEVAERLKVYVPQLVSGENAALFVAETRDARLVGYASVHWLTYLFLNAPEGFVSELFVRSEARGQGLGRRLVAAVKLEAQARGCTRLHLVNIKERESYKRGFYPQLGFAERPDVADFIYVF